MSTARASLVEAMQAEELSADGRLARGQRARRKVAEALLELLHEGGPEPTAKIVAKRAGVSLRLVFHHFSDIDDLYRAAALLQLERYWSALPMLSATLPRPTRIDRTVRYRSVLYEEISPVRRAAVRRSGTSAEITEGLAFTNVLLRDNTLAAFGPELNVLPKKQRDDRLAALDSATSWEVWERLRQNSGLTVAAAKRVMAFTLHALLDVDV